MRGIRGKVFPVGRRGAFLLTALMAMATPVIATPTATAATKGSIIRVPSDKPTIQAAVDASKSGTLILIAPGTYKEAVVVSPKHPNIVIRGEDRATTILDGEFSSEAGKENGFKVFADGVAIENMTVQNFSTNGFYWIGAKGYRGSYITAIRNGDYGIYAFDSVKGQFDHAYASGSPDAGFYIGQCYPCDALIVDSESEWNGLGYSGTNAGGNLLIARSSWHDNRAGIVPNSGTGEKLYPQRETTIIGNSVYDNNNAGTAAIEIAQVAIGNGILIAGGNNNLVERNRVENHTVTGIGIIPLPETVLNPDSATAKDFDSKRNSVLANIVQKNLYDLVSVTSLTDASDAGKNCFAGNTYTTSSPPDIEKVLPCKKPAVGYEADIALFASLLGSTKPPSIDYQAVALPSPPKLANMPKAKTAAARAATNEPSIKISVKKLSVPAE
jgi:hypothetical protein